MIFFICCSVAKLDAGDTREVGSFPGLGRFSGVGYGNPLQYSCLENPMNRVAWWATVHGALTESDTTQGLNNNHVKV